MKHRVLGLAVVTVLLSGAMSTDTASAKYRTARVNLTTGLGNRIGRVTFMSVGRHTDVIVSLNTGGLSEVEVDVFHAFHIHANDNDANGRGCVADPADRAGWFQSADGHYNPGQARHPHHAGDMPVLYFNSDGGVQARFRLDYIKPADLIGKAVVVHAGPDNFGNIPGINDDPASEDPGRYKWNSQAARDATWRTGDAGGRVACGVIS